MKQKFDGAGADTTRKVWRQKARKALAQTYIDVDNRRWEEKKSVVVVAVVVVDVVIMQLLLIPSSGGSFLGRPESRKCPSS